MISSTSSTSSSAGSTSSSRGKIPLFYYYNIIPLLLFLSSPNRRHQKRRQKNSHYLSTSIATSPSSAAGGAGDWRRGERREEVGAGDHDQLRCEDMGFGSSGSRGARRLVEGTGGCLHGGEGGIQRSGVGPAIALDSRGGMLVKLVGGGREEAGGWGQGSRTSPWEDFGVVGTTTIMGIGGGEGTGYAAVAVGAVATSVVEVDVLILLHLSSHSANLSLASPRKPSNSSIRFPAACC